MTTPQETTTPQALFEQQARTLAAEPQRTAGLTASYQFDLAGDQGGTWALRIVDGKATIEPGPASDPDVTIRMTAKDFVDMCTGRLDGGVAFMQGKLRVLGDAGLGMRLRDIMAG